MTAVSFGVLASFGSTDPHTRKLLLASAGTFLAILPYTLVRLGPINADLGRLAKADAEQQQTDIETTATVVDDLLARWESGHAVRMVIGAIGFGLGVVAALPRM